MHMKRNFGDTRGQISPMLIWVALLGVMTVAFAGLSVWAYMNYLSQKQDVDSKVTAAVATAVKKQSDTDETKFAEREKQPLKQFAGLDDYGHITFDYSKTWNAYQATDVSNGNGATYAVYLHNSLVPPAPDSPLNDLSLIPKSGSTSKTDVSKFALRVVVEQKSYDTALKQYDEYIKSGQLKSSVFTNDNKITGTRLDGSFNQNIRGSAIVIKMRDRTLTLRTDADAFKKDFDALIKTLNFNY